MAQVLMATAPPLHLHEGTCLLDDTQRGTWKGQVLGTCQATECALPSKPLLSAWAAQRPGARMNPSRRPF